ncbi:response regulator [Leptolyngbya sp. FACHB-711]|uniref:response regulator n=1 Tax=unclassified Leptolyngbya TaxID=2650499 RepID=UPI001682992F|nr:response regulator [Leptolyngbya sp. FACHB-711]MBD1849172.1 response regulator [Cyanobacteria bacterium FACHB-502]MBD2022983.1 response regulator [Leptolyngbya sp. FACHB-711]
MAVPPCTVLIVENFLPDRELYRRSLLTDTSCGYRLLEVDTAMEGLELCRTESIDAILLDYLLPDCDGLEFLQALHAQNSEDSPPVVIVTGQGDESIAVQALKLGAEDYLVKRRLTPDLLRLTVRSAIENARLRLQLRESDDRFRVSIENMLDCFGIFSAIRDSGGQILDFQISYLNAAALQNHQMTTAGINVKLGEVLPATRETGQFDQYCRVVETGEPLVKEELTYIDGFGTPLLYRAFDIRASKFNDGFVASWRDVTARKQAELERQQQLEREQIVHQITQQIRQSLDLKDVLHTAVTEVREFLSTDRAFIYRFNPDFSGTIVVESVSNGLPAAIGARVQDTYFLETHGEDYRQGRIQVVEDIYTAGLTDCHVEMLVQFQIRANLIVPILQGEQLWGLLVLSQCACPRQWQPVEIDLLRQIAAQLGIALKQAELYEQARAELTERQRAESALQQSHDRFELAAAAVNCLIYDWDLQCNRVERTQGLYEVTGYLLEEADPSPEWWLDLIHPDDRPKKNDESVFSDLAKLGRYCNEYRVLHKNGRYLWVEDWGTVLKDDSGQPVRIVGSTRAIHKRKLTEQRLHQSEEQLQLGVQVAGVALVRFDYATDRARLSSEASAMFGIPAEETLIADDLVVSIDRLYAVFHPRERRELLEMIQQVLDPAGKGYLAHEHRVLWQTGEVRWLSIRKQVFFDRSTQPPRPDYGILAAIDITERKRAEATVQAQLAQIEAIYATAPIGLCFLDRERRFVQLNERLAEMNGLSVSDHLGRTIRELLPELAEVQEPIFEQVLQTGVPVLDVEVQGTTPAQPGIERHWLVSYYPLIAAAGRVLGINIMVQEITGRKRVEDERKRAELERDRLLAEAEAANRSKDEFVALVAHELRSPLNAILGWAKLMQTRRLDPATTAKALETIARNTQAQVQLVEDLLDVSRMVRGTLKLTLASVNLLEVMEAAIETVRPLAETKPLQLKMQLDKTAPISGDFNRLQQIVLNLLTNAIKFTPQGGSVEVRLEQVGKRHEEISSRAASNIADQTSANALPLTPSLPHSYAQITITDTGIGIAPDFLPQVFQRFCQDSQNVNAKEGLGLGLAIVKYLVELHGGTVTVASGGKGQGTTFVVRLPLLKRENDLGAEENLEQVPLASDGSLAGVRVLLVDDQPDMLDLTTFALEEYGAIVETASSATTALEKLPQFKPQILLSDIAMPQQDGYGLLQQVRSIYPEGQIPAIALTAYASYTRREAAFRAGFQEYLTKPLEPEQLVSTIQALIKHSGFNS